MEQKVGWAVAFMLFVAAIVAAAKVLTNPRLIPDLMPKAFVADFVVFAVIGLLVNGLYATSVSVFGRKLGGKATITRMFIVGAYSTAPLVLAGTNFTALFGVIWSAILGVIGLRVAHGVTTRVAVALHASFLAFTTLLFGLTFFGVLNMRSESIFPAQQLLNKPVPEVAFKKLDGSGEVPLTHLRGKVVLIDFWATWCGPCVASMPDLSDLAKEYENQGVVALAVANDTPELAKKYLDSKNYKFIGLQGTNELSDKFHVLAIPETLVVDRDGIVRAVHVGASQDEKERVRADILKCLQPTKLQIEPSH